MSTVFQYSIIFVLCCLGLCHGHGCESISRRSDSYEIHNCTHLILPLSISKKAKDLRKLVLAGNGLGALLQFNTFRNLPQLEYLELTENGLEYLQPDDNMQTLPYLTELRIRERKMILCSNELQGRRQLLSLWVETRSLSATQINFRQFPPTLLNMYIVNTKVDIKWSFNHIGVDRRNFKMPLANLTMRNCTLRVIALHQCEDTLTYLDLSQNKFKSFHGLGNLKALRILNMSDNLIDAIGENDFVRMISIEKLILSNNLIKTIPGSSFDANINLRDVDLTNNELSRLYQDLKNIAKISIHGKMLQLRSAPFTDYHNYTIISSTAVKSVDKLKPPGGTPLLCNSSPFMLLVILILIISGIFNVLQQRKISTITALNNPRTNAESVRMSHMVESEIYVPHSEWDSVTYEDDDEPHYQEILYDE